MLLIHLDKLNDFAKTHADKRKCPGVRKTFVTNPKWRRKQDVLNDFPNAKMINNNRARLIPRKWWIPAVE